MDSDFFLIYGIEGYDDDPIQGEVSMEKILKKALVTLLGIRKFRRTFLSDFDKNIILLIAKQTNDNINDGNYNIFSKFSVKYPFYYLKCPSIYGIAISCTHDLIENPPYVFNGTLKLIQGEVSKSIETMFSKCFHKSNFYRKSDGSEITEEEFSGIERYVKPRIYGFSSQYICYRCYVVYGFYCHTHNLDFYLDFDCGPYNCIMKSLSYGVNRSRLKSLWNYFIGCVVQEFPRMNNHKNLVKWGKLLKKEYDVPTFENMKEIIIDALEKIKKGSNMCYELAQFPVLTFICSDDKDIFDPHDI